MSASKCTPEIAAEICQGWRTADRGEADPMPIVRFDPCCSTIRRLPSALPLSRSRYRSSFQLAEIVVLRQIFAEILSLIARLRAPLAPV